MANLRSDPVWRAKENQRRKELRKKKREMSKIPELNTSTPPVTCFEDGGTYPVHIKTTITTSIEYDHGKKGGNAENKKIEDNFVFINDDDELKRARKNFSLKKLYSFAKY